MKWISFILAETSILRFLSQWQQLLRLYYYAWLQLQYFQTSYVYIQ